MTNEKAQAAPQDQKTIMLSAGTIPKATFTQRVTAAAETGFATISLFPEHYLNALKHENLSVADMQAILAANGLSIEKVDPLLDWFNPASQGASRSESLLYEIANAFGRVCERAARHGLLATLKFLLWTVVPNLSTALQIVSDCAQPNARVMLGTWHFFHSGAAGRRTIPSVCRARCDGRSASISLRGVAMGGPVILA